jgi:hypothetical protein
MNLSCVRVWESLRSQSSLDLEVPFPILCVHVHVRTRLSKYHFLHYHFCLISNYYYDHFCLITNYVQQILVHKKKVHQIRASTFGPYIPSNKQSHYFIQSRKLWSCLPSYIYGLLRKHSHLYIPQRREFVRFLAEKTWELRVCVCV